MFVAENVKGLVNLSNVKQIIQDDFSKIGDGYLVLEPKVLNASHFGVPQNRERVFFIGFRKDALRFDAYESLLSKESPLSPYPKDTFSKNGINKLVLPEEVFDILVEPEISSDISQQYYSKAKYLSNGSQGQSEIPRDRPATTVRAEHHGNIEFRRLSKKNGGKFIEELDNGLLQRRLSVRECALLQSFPPNWEFVIPLPNKQNRFHVSASQAYKAIGNAVPPLLAYNLARQIQDNWSKYFYDC
jgi:DNA (cytosine-5)-methyltransferase 1